VRIAGDQKSTAAHCQFDSLTRIDGAGFFAIARQRQPAVNGLHKIARIAGSEIAPVAQVRR
jgi:hypothetical protein